MTIKPASWLQKFQSKARRPQIVINAEFQLEIVSLGDIMQTVALLVHDAVDAEVEIGLVKLEQLGQQGLETHEHEALNERDYGELVGLNKDDARKRWGEDQVHIWRRSFDTPPPGGESLKDTADRVLPYFNAEILPKVLAGKNVIVSAHGNSLRALVMQLDRLSPEAVTSLNLATGAPMIYRLNSDGTVAEKLELAA